MSVALTEKLIEDVRLLIKDQDRDTLGKLIFEMQPADVADLAEQLEHEERLYIIELLMPEEAGEVLLEMEPPVQERILDSLDAEAITKIVQELDSDDAADLVGDLPAERVKEIIDSVQTEVREELQKLLPFPEDTAGGLMALEYVAVNANATVQEAIEKLRKKREEVENLYSVFVVDDYSRLSGAVSLKDLVLEPPDRKIKDIMNPEILSVDVDTDQEEVARLFQKYDLVSVPVVDDQHRLIGRITHDDIMDVIEEEADEDMSMMAGVMHQEIGEESPLRISRARLPWLIVGLFGGILAAVVINQFESSLEKVIALSFFFPVIMAMGGNTGIQAATVAVRGLATGDISLVGFGRRIVVEMKVAFLNGLVCAVILGLVVSIWLADILIGSVVALSLILIILNACFIGASVPLVLKRLNIDPALATGPFVTTTNDIISLFIYLLLMSGLFRFSA
ncbi:MAG: magnesium transporter [Deltaproteobacteria bacterium HGW-Deltaproteobacteria-15]|nr:MAG: magnesium transporter [Deltaproteobacteria bacterium HGW-Deltaproteobacteria-15]